MNASRRETFSQFPYPGLRPFDPEETDIFFGRDAQIDELLSRLSQTRFLAIVGPSGCGKSSLVSAGMLPALAGGFMAGTSAQWAIAKMRPGEHPLSRLVEVLLRDTPLGETLDPDSDDFSEDCAMMEAMLRRGPLGLVEALRGSPLDQRGKPEAERMKLLVLVDQFEEIFRYRTGMHDKVTDDEKDAFVALLLESKSQQEFPIFVVITMRSDFIGDCAIFPGLPETINDGLYLTPRLTRAECREAIVGPAELFKIRFEPALVNRLLNDSGSDPDQLPLLQHVLMRLWRKRFGPANSTADSKDEESIIGIDLYESPTIGGFTQALSRHLDHVYYDCLDDGQKRLAEILFKALCERRGDQKDIRRPTALGTIAEIAKVSWEELADVVKVFRKPGRNFLSPRRGELRQETVLDISHESLIRNWKRLGEWVEQEAESARQYRRLEDTAKLWKKGDANRWRGVDLEMALRWKQRDKPIEAWAVRYGSQFPLAMQFLESSRVRRNWGYCGRAAVGLIVIGLTVSVFQWTQYVKRKNLNIEQAKLDAQKTYSLHFLDVFDYLTDRAEIGRMAAVDVAGEYLRNGRQIPVAALLAICAAIDEPGNPIPHLQIPPRQPFFLTIMENNQIALWDEAEPKGIYVLWRSEIPRLAHKFGSVEQRIRKIGVNKDGTRFGIQCTDGKIFVWSLADHSKKEPGALTLESALELTKEEAESEKFMKTSPGEYWSPYDELARRWVVEVASSVTRRYTKDERNALGLEPGNSDRLTDRIVEAREKVEMGRSIEQAYKSIMKDFGFTEDNAKEILCMTFVNEGLRLQDRRNFQEAKTSYANAKGVGALSDNEIDGYIALAEAEQASADGNKAEAETKYAEAKKLNPELGPKEVRRLIKKGNTLATQGDREGAIQAYKRALELDPPLSSTLVPEVEYQKFAPRDEPQLVAPQLPLKNTQ